MGTSHLDQVRPRWDHSHQVKVWPRYLREYPGPNDAQVGPESTGPGEAQIWIRVILFQVSPDGYHGNKVQESPIWDPEPPDPSEFKVGPQSQGPGEAQVAKRLTKSRRGPGGDQLPDPGADQIRTRFTRSS